MEDLNNKVPVQIGTMIHSISELQPPKVLDGLPQNDFADVELTEEETEDALREGRKRKWHILQRIKAKQADHDYWEGLKRPQEYPIMSSSMFSDWVIKNRVQLFIKGKFEMDKAIGRIYELLTYYFTNDERFCDGTGFSLQKGVALFGNIGTGKTTLMRLFSINPGQSYFMTSCSKISESYSNWNSKEEPICPIDRYYLNEKVGVNDNYFGHKLRGFCLDDLGTETIPAKNYGRDKNVIADILMQRYANQLPFNTCHFTTNLSLQSIEVNYGSRVSDRMNEMFNIINFPKGAKSRR